MGSNVFVYVAHLGSREVSSWRMGSDGALTAMQTLAVSGKVMPMTVSPDKRFLYAALRSQPYSVAGFSIDAASGMLAHMGDTPVPDSLVYISTDRTGRNLLCAVNPSGDKTRRTGMLSVSPIDAAGRVGPVRQVFRTEPKIHAIMADPSNRHVFATSCDGDVVLRHRLNLEQGMLSRDVLAPIRVIRKSGPRHFTFSPDGRFFYLLNEYDATVYAFEYEPVEGMLNELQIVDTIPEGAAMVGDHRRAADIHITPDGRFLYSSERTTHTLAMFRRDVTSGTLTPNGHVPTGREPRSFAIDPSGTFLIVAAVLSDTLSVYRIDQDAGTLSLAGTYPVGKGPNWIEIVELGS